MVTAGVDERGSFVEVGFRCTALPRIFTVQFSEEARAMEKGVDEVKPHPAQPTVLFVATSSGHGKGLIQPLAGQCSIATKCV